MHMAACYILFKFFFKLNMLLRLKAHVVVEREEILKIITIKNYYQIYYNQNQRTNTLLLISIDTSLKTCRPVNN